MTPSGTLSTSLFGRAVFSWAHPPVMAPTTLSITSDHHRVKVVLPYYEKMEVAAPNAQTKEDLGFVVTLLTDYSTSTTLAELEFFQKAHSAQFKSE